MELAVTLQEQVQVLIGAAFIVPALATVLTAVLILLVGGQTRS